MNMSNFSSKGVVRPTFFASLFNPGNYSAASLARLVLLAALALLCATAVAALAQISPAPPFVASVTVVPDVAPPGVARTLMVDGIWPNGCVPRSASLRLQDVGPQQFVVVVLQRAPDSVCTLATQRFSYSVSFTPMVPATQPVVIQTDDGVRGGEGSVRTTTAGLPAPLTPIISVVPDVDIPNRARTIVISGQHLANCPFMTPTIDGQTGPLINGVVIRMDPVQTLVPCNTNSTTAYRFELPYTPTQVGTQRVVLASASGQIRSESQIRTSAVQGRTRAVGDITGVWYDQATNGSGLQFTHNFAGSDFVFGTWYLYDLAGRSRWLSIQNVVWQAGGTVLTGDLLETRAFPTPCAVSTCENISPRPMSSMTKVGTVRISFTGLGPYSDTLPQGVAEATLTGGGNFTSNITRIPL
jgi:hypothetical protein